MFRTDIPSSSARVSCEGQQWSRSSVHWASRPQRSFAEGERLGYLRIQLGMVTPKNCLYGEKRGETTCESFGMWHLPRFAADPAGETSGAPPLGHIGSRRDSPFARRGGEVDLTSLSLYYAILRSVSMGILCRPYLSVTWIVPSRPSAPATQSAT